jgi:toxin ParE1/3/4
VRRGFVLTPEANSDLREILLHIAEESPAAAERLRTEIYEALRHLAQSPGMGHYHDELLHRRYRFWNWYSYVICYRWDRKPIQIIAVVHGARELGAFFATRVGGTE